MTISFFSALFLGRWEELGNAVLNGASSAVNVVFGLVGIMCLWCGIMEVLKERGVTARLSKIISPVLRLIFPDASKTGEGLEEISGVISANLLGMGNAATPLALRAMQRLEKTNQIPGTASADMITLAVLSTAPLSLLPTTVIALLNNAGASNPYKILPAVWITSAACSIFAVLICRIAAGISRCKR